MPAAPRSAADALREGRRLGAAGEFAAAARGADAALAKWPDDAELHLLRAAVAERLRDPETVLRHVQRFEALAPEREPADLMAGAALVQLRRAPEAVVRLERAVARRPNDDGPWTNLGIARREAGDLLGALEAQRRARSLAPEKPQPTLNIASLLAGMGRVPEAIEALRERLVREPADAESARTEAILSLYLDERTPAQIAALHRRVGDLFTRAAPAAPPRAAVRPSPRRLRVGFVSPDLGEHAVASFLLPVLEALDRARLEPILFSNSPLADATTGRLRAAAAGWHEVAGLSTSALVDLARRERLDIAVDLAGLTFGHRLDAFAARMAPLQATWLGYPGTTGLRAMDVRLVDSATDPPGSEGLCVERLVRLDPSFLCWRPRAASPLPDRTRGAGEPPVFGSFSELTKISDRSLDVWARVLAAVPEARFLVKAFGLRHEPARALLLERLAARGVAAERVELLGYTAGYAEHLALYGRVDVALDTMPYNGTTTTLEALWMVTPVVALRGVDHRSRVASSILDAIGRSELAAADLDGYVERAVGLARDAEARARHHATLRDALERSPLMDAPAFARRFEAALREEWARRGGER